MVSMASKRDFYEVLGVSQDASPDVVKKAYKKLALANHPDRNPGDDEATTRFKEAAEAYEVISNPDKRSRYDRFGHEGVSGANGRGGFQDVGDIFDLFGDLFEGFGFGGARSGRRRGRGQEGASLQTALTIDLLEAAKGCSRSINIQRNELCRACSGSGAKPGSTPDRCDYCGGHGQVVQSQGFFRLQTTCPSCRGAGTVIRDKCGDCRGSGRQPESVELDVAVRAGVDNGTRLRVTGQGEPGANGGPRGDLYVDIHVNEHPLFTREGQHLICRVPVTYTQAALGTELDIPVLEGRYTQTIPPGTQPGQVFRIRGGGMPDLRTGRPGDLLIEVQVQVPKALGEEHETLLRQLADLEQADVSEHHKSFLDRLKEWFTTPDGDE